MVASVDKDPRESLPIDSLAAGAMASAGAALGWVDPALGVAAVGVTTAAAPILTRLIETWRERRSRNVAQAVVAGIDSSGESFEVLAEASGSDPFREQLTADVLEAASRSALADKIVALGKAWAKGVLTQDDGELAQEQQFVIGCTA